MAFKNFAVRNGLEVEGSVYLSGSTSGTTEIKAAADALGIYTLPSALPTASGQVLTSTDVGVLAWTPAITASGADQRIQITRDTTTTNLPVNTLQLRANCTGTPVVGFGTSLLYQVETASGTFKDAGSINVQSTDVTTGSEDFKMNFALMVNGAGPSAVASLTNAGNLSLDGTVSSGTNTGSSFFNKVNIGANVNADTELSMDNLNVRLHTTTGNNMQVQASAVSGTFSAYTTIVNNVAGSAMSGETNASAITFTAGTWSSIGSSAVLGSGGDMITVHLHDNTNLRIYRITTMRGAGTSPNKGHISIERLA